MHNSPGILKRYQGFFGNFSFGRKACPKNIHLAESGHINVTGYKIGIHVPFEKTKYHAVVPLPRVFGQYGCMGISFMQGNMSSSNTY